jgi:hypothetical protein
LKLCGQELYLAARKNLKSKNPLSESEELVLGMFIHSAIILDAIQQSFFIKTAAMFTSVQVDFGQLPPSSYSTSSLPSQDHEYLLKTFDPFRASIP